MLHSVSWTLRFFHAPLRFLLKFLNVLLYLLGIKTPSRSTLSSRHQAPSFSTQFLSWAHLGSALPCPTLRLMLLSSLLGLAMFLVRISLCTTLLRALLHPLLGILHTPHRLLLKLHLALLCLLVLRPRAPLCPILKLLCGSLYLLDVKVPLYLALPLGVKALCFASSLAWDLPHFTSSPRY